MTGPGSDDGRAARRAALRRLALSVTGGALSSTVLSTVLMLVSSIVLARLMALESYGTYVFVAALINLLVIPAQFGAPHFLMRETARQEALDDGSTLRTVWTFALCFVAISVTSTVVVYLGALALLDPWIEGPRAAALPLAAWVVPFVALATCFGFILRGLRRTFLGQSVTFVPRYGGIILGALLLSAGLGYSIDARAALSIHAVGAAAGMLIGAGFVWRYRPRSYTTAGGIALRAGPWMASMAMLGTLTGFQILNKNADVVGLGLFADAEQVGIYRAAAQTAVILSLGLGVLNVALAPYLARLHAQDRTAELQRVISLSVAAITGLALPVIVLIVIFRKAILVLLFGAQFEAASGVLLVLVFGQLVNVIFGPVGLLLNMSGLERSSMRMTGYATVANLVLICALTPFFGMIGTAVASVVTMTIWNVLLWRIAYRDLQIDTSILSVVQLRR